MERRHKSFYGAHVSFLPQDGYNHGIPGNPSNLLLPDYFSSHFPLTHFLTHLADKIFDVTNHGAIATYES